MFAILEAYHDEGLQSGGLLSAYANQLLSREPGPTMPAGMSRPDFARSMVDRVEKTPGKDPSAGLQWLLDALVAWNDCAEAYVWISNIIEGREHAQLLMQPFYLLAIEALKRRVGPLPAGATLDPAAAEVQLMAKALVGLGESLATGGKPGQATRRYLDALRWDPDDTQEARPRLAIALTLQGEVESAGTAIAPARSTIFSAYAAAVVAYARSEGSAEAREILLAADAINPDVGAIITGRRKMLGMLTGQARFDEAQYVCLMLDPVLKGLPGFAAWAKRDLPVASAPKRTGTPKKRR
jgi:hypothetical protein